MLSQLLKRQVYDQKQTLIGILVDVVVPLPNGGTLPVQTRKAARVTPLVQALIVQHHDGTRLQVSPTQVAQVETQRLLLTCTRGTLPVAEPHPAVLPLAEAVLDHEILDLAHLRVERVNDLWVDDLWRLVGVDCRSLRLLSRLLPARLTARYVHHNAYSLLPWHQVALFPTACPDEIGPLPLLLPAGSRALASWSGASLAEVVQHLRPYAASQVLLAVSPALAAKALGRLPPPQRLQVFKHLPVSQVTAILKQLSPALAMAVLAALPQARAQAVLEGLSPEETVALQGAPAYPTYTAGGLMTSVCLRVSQDATAAEAIALLRSYSGTPGQRAYLYCVAGGLTTFSEAHLVGVVSLWEVLAVDPTCRLRGFMRKDVVSVTPWTDLRTVANVLEAHELLALPVVDEQGRFLGSVTLEALLPYLVPARRTWQWPITQKHARAVPQR